MSAVTKRKYVFRETMDDYVIPDEKQRIAKVVTANLGNSLFGLETEDGQSFLASLPKKFRNTIFIKTGNYVIINPIEEGDKVRAEICVVLMPPQIKYLAELKKWPQSFQLPLKCQPDLPPSNPSKNLSTISSIIPSDMLPPSDDEEDADDDDDDDEEEDEEDGEEVEKKEGLEERRK